MFISFTERYLQLTNDGCTGNEYSGKNYRCSSSSVLRQKGLLIPSGPKVIISVYPECLPELIHMQSSGRSNYISSSVAVKP